VLGLDYQDGRYGIVNYTWLWTGTSRNVLEVYAVGRVPMVQLVGASSAVGCPETRGYKPLTLAALKLSEPIDEAVVGRLAGLFRATLGAAGAASAADAAAANTKSSLA
jgi:hypothetical protein